MKPKTKEEMATLCKKENQSFLNFFKFLPFMLSVLYYLGWGVGSSGTARSPQDPWTPPKKSEK
jgi:hypothetical protein